MMPRRRSREQLSQGSPNSDRRGGAQLSSRSKIATISTSVVS